jgi:hypothetical protein
MEPKHQLAAEMLRDTLCALCPFPGNAQALCQTLIAAGMQAETAFAVAYAPEEIPLWMFIAAADLLGAKLLLALPDSADAGAITAALSGLRAAPDGHAN